MTAPMATQPATTVADVLDKAADLIAAPGAWTQGDFARDANGNGYSYVEDFTPFNEFDGKCFCLFGALAHVSGVGDPEKYRDADRVLLSVVPGARTVGDIADWNDRKSRTQSEVVAKLREAAALAREQGK